MQRKREAQSSGLVQEPYFDRKRVRPHESRITQEDSPQWAPSVRLIGDRAVEASLPLSNMISEIRYFIDPDFDRLPTPHNEQPRFLKPLHHRTSSEDLIFLQSRGALSIPERKLCYKLLGCYVRWVHWFTPALDLHRLLHAIAHNDPEGNISILLFQAVMFVATAFVDLECLQAAGYQTRQVARNAFARRVKLLYSFEVEEDRVVVLQTALLMTHWSDPEGSPHRDLWDWISICKTKALSIGLNHDPSKSDTDACLKRLRVRLWWSLYVRDRLVALGTRRPLQIDEGTFEVPMLQMEDLDLETFDGLVFEKLGCHELQDGSLRNRLGRMFIEKIKLCQCIGKVLSTQYIPGHRQIRTTAEASITLVPRQPPALQLACCTQYLETWYTELPKDAKLSHVSNLIGEEEQNILYLHGSILQMLYQATVSALHRHIATGSSGSHIRPSRYRTREAATDITHIIKDLNKRELTRFLPQTALTVLLCATATHLGHAMSIDPLVHEPSMTNFRTCYMALNTLKDRYPAVDIEMIPIEVAVKRMSIPHCPTVTDRLSQADETETSTVRQDDLVSQSRSPSEKCSRMASLHTGIRRGSHLLTRTAGTKKHSIEMSIPQPRISEYKQCPNSHLDTDITCLQPSFSEALGASEVEKEALALIANIDHLLSENDTVEQSFSPIAGLREELLNDSAVDQTLGGLIWEPMCTTSQPESLYTQGEDSASPFPRDNADDLDSVSMIHLAEG